MPKTKTMTWAEMYRVGAVEAARKRVTDPLGGWENACRSAWEKAGGLPSEKACRSFWEKHCPRDTFLGLCEAGYVVGMMAGNYIDKETPNKKYAIDGADALLQGEQKYGKLDIETLVNVLWERVRPQCTPPQAPMKHNEQMNVVVALWKAHLLKKP